MYLNVHFKTKHNVYLNEHALTEWLIVLHISCISNNFFRYISIKYYIAFCNMHMEELKSPWLRIEKKNFEEKTVSMKSIHDIEDSFYNKSL